MADTGYLKDNEEILARLRTLIRGNMNRGGKL
jgi:hypothetical protein